MFTLTTIFYQAQQARELLVLSDGARGEPAHTGGYEPNHAGIFRNSTTGTGYINLPVLSGNSTDALDGLQSSLASA